VRPFITAGIDTTIGAISASVLGLAESGDWEKLTENRDLAPQAFEEAVRWSSPIQSVFRTTACDVEIGGNLIPKKSKVLMMMGAANRDPRKFESPDKYILGRKTSGHLGFGSGIHTCAGQMMARVEGEALLRVLSRRVKSISLESDPEFELSNTTRVLKAAKVTVVAF